MNRMKQMRSGMNGEFQVFSFQQKRHFARRTRRRRRPKKGEIENEEHLEGGCENGVMEHFKCGVRISECGMEWKEQGTGEFQVSSEGKAEGGGRGTRGGSEWRIANFEWRMRSGTDGGHHKGQRLKAKGGGRMLNSKG